MNNSETVRDKVKVTTDHLNETRAELSEFAVILVVKATCVGKAPIGVRQYLE